MALICFKYKITCDLTLSSTFYNLSVSHNLFSKAEDLAQREPSVYKILKLYFSYGSGEKFDFFDAAEVGAGKQKDQVAFVVDRSEIFR